jgi:hypothetical protein
MIHGVYNYDGSNYDFISGFSKDITSESIFNCTEI